MRGPHASIARPNVTLDDVEPTVMRRLEVQLAMTKDRLHIVLKVILGWTNSHPYEFRIKELWALAPLVHRDSIL